MKRKEGLQKLEYLIKELNDTHSRLQIANENMQHIEASLLNHQLINIYGHIQGLLPNLKDTEAGYEVSRVSKEKEIVPPSKSASERKKALLKGMPEKKEAEIKHVPEIKNDEEEEEEYVEEVPSLNTEEVMPESPEETPYSAPHTPEEEEEEEIEESKLHSSIKPSEVSLHEKLGLSNEPSLNEKFSGMQNKQSLSDKLKLTPVKDLKSAIGLNQKVTFINVLFKGSDKDFKSAISAINNFGHFSEAKIYISNNLSSKYNWDEQNETVTEFMQLVQRRFL